MTIYKNFRLSETFRADREDYRGCWYCGKGFAQGDEICYIEYDGFLEHDGTEWSGDTGLFHPVCFSACEGREIDSSNPR